MRANEDDQQQIDCGPTEGQATAPKHEGREPYMPPVIEKFPPMGNVTFGTNVQPMLAMSLAGA